MPQPVYTVRTEFEVVIAQLTGHQRQATDNPKMILASVTHFAAQKGLQFTTRTLTNAAIEKLLGFRPGPGLRPPTVPFNVQQFLAAELADACGYFDVEPDESGKTEGKPDKNLKDYPFWPIHKKKMERPFVDLIREAEERNRLDKLSDLGMPWTADGLVRVARDLLWVLEEKQDGVLVPVESEPSLVRRIGRFAANSAMEGLARAALGGFSIG